MRDDANASDRLGTARAYGRRLRALASLVAASLCCAGHTLLLGGGLTAITVPVGWSVLLLAATGIAVTAAAALHLWRYRTASIRADRGRLADHPCRGACTTKGGLT